MMKLKIELLKVFLLEFVWESNKNKKKGDHIEDALEDTADTDAAADKQ